MTWVIINQYNKCLVDIFPPTLYNLDINNFWTTVMSLYQATQPIGFVQDNLSYSRLLLDRYHWHSHLKNEISQGIFESLQAETQCNWTSIKNSCQSQLFHSSWATVAAVRGTLMSAGQSLIWQTRPGSSTLERPVKMMCVTQWILEIFQVCH